MVEIREEQVEETRYSVQCRKCALRIIGNSKDQIIHNLKKHMEFKHKEEVQNG